MASKQVLKRSSNGLGRQHPQSAANRPRSSQMEGRVFFANGTPHKISISQNNESSGRYIHGDDDSVTHDTGRGRRSPAFLPSYRHAYTATYLTSDAQPSSDGLSAETASVPQSPSLNGKQSRNSSSDGILLQSRCCACFHRRPLSSVAPMASTTTTKHECNGIQAFPQKSKFGAKSFKKLRSQLCKCTPSTSCLIIALGILQMSVVVVCVVVLCLNQFLFNQTSSDFVVSNDIPVTPANHTANFTIDVSNSNISSSSSAVSANSSNLLYFESANTTFTFATQRPSFIPTKTVIMSSTSFSSSMFTSLFVLLVVSVLISFVTVAFQTTRDKRIIIERKRAATKVASLESANAAALNLLYRMLPQHVCSTLLAGKLPACEYFESVTVYFSDIVGFTEIAARSKPIEVVALLNKLYSLLDDRIDLYDVYKIETIGDAYMMVSGAPRRNGIRHAGEMATLTLDLQQLIRDFELPHMPGILLQLRIGLNSGNVMAGIVGLKMPRYCLFGDTVNTASRMESTGKPGRVHLSASTKALLDELGAGIYEVEERGVVEVKGKNEMLTYWLLAKAGFEFKIESDVCAYVPRKRKAAKPRLSLEPKEATISAAVPLDRKASQLKPSPPNAVEADSPSLTTSTKAVGNGNVAHQQPHDNNVSPVVPITQRVGVT